jgi:4-hydroxybenzoate polyprenyltransferase
MPFWIGVLAGRPLTSLLILFVGGSPLATAIHLADAIPDRERDREAGLRTLAVSLGRPRAEIAAAAVLLIGSLVSILVFVRRGQPSIATLSLAGIVASALLFVGVRAIPSSVVLGKWVVITAATLAAVPLVASASER